MISKENIIESLKALTKNLLRSSIGITVADGTVIGSSSSEEVVANMPNLIFRSVPDLRKVDPLILYDGISKAGELTRYDYKGNPWENLVLDMYSGGEHVYHREIDLGVALMFNVIDAAVSSSVVTKEIFDSFENGRYSYPAIKYHLCHFNMKLRRGDEDTETRIPLFYELKNAPQLAFYRCIDPETNFVTDHDPLFGGWLRLMYALPRNEHSKKILLLLKDVLANYPIAGNIENLLGNEGMHFGRLGTEEFENVGNHMPAEVEELKMTIQADPGPATSVFDGISARAAFACAKVNPTITFKSGHINNCHAMFKGTRGTTTDPERMKNEVYFSPCKLKIGYEGKKYASADYPFFGLVPTTIADCFKFSYLNQKSYDEFFLKANFRHCRDFSGAFAEQVFNRVFNAEEDGFAPEMVGHGSFGDYGKITIKDPALYDEAGFRRVDPVAFSVWYPGMDEYDKDKKRWSVNPTGGISYMCKYSHVAVIEPIIDCTYLYTDAQLYQAFHCPPGQVNWPGYRGLRSQIQSLRLRNLGNRDYNFAGTVTDWATTNNPDWNLESLDRESVVYLLYNMRDQSLYVNGKEDELFLLGPSFSLRIPEKWEAYMTGGMVASLMRKGWRVYIGNDTKSLEDYIVCTEEEEEPDYL